MQLYFDENLANTVVHQKLTRSLKKTFYAADHCLSVFSSLVAVAQLEDKLKGFTHPCVFTNLSILVVRKYRAYYHIYITIPRHPLGRVEMNIYTTPFFYYLVDCGHVIDKIKGFKTVS